MSKESKKETPCIDCQALCCKYVVMEIDAPETPRDIENFRWYVSHRGCAVFREEGRWYFEVAAVCKHLDDENRCSIYPRRPSICRSHRADSCEKIDPRGCWDLRLESIDQVEAYARSAFAKKPSR